MTLLVPQAVSDDLFAPVATGPYAVHSVGEAGVERVEFEGFHYPYQALAVAEELQSASGLRERERRMQSRMLMNASPDDIVRRSGAGA